ncbi:AMP-binding protein [Paenibacillus senegalensis]|uniref:AMP-binding protein n=1 Tax=Paenibacillus senegalensis TaxID=1465766 RepID=UPI00028988DE|nr:AMP-binding protein [Paenibacillus senegalensis]
MEPRVNWRQALLRVDRLMPGHFPWLGGKNGNSDKDETPSFSSLPLVTSGVLEQFYYNDSNPLARRNDLYTYQTSGTSSGHRKTIYYTQRDEDEYLRIKQDVFRKILGADTYRKALADMGTGHAAATAVDVFRCLGMEAESISFQQPIAEHVACLTEYQPDVLYTMPSILDRILHASPNPQDYQIKKVILVGEIATHAWIQSAANRLGIDKTQIVDTYGSIEVGTISYYCHKHERYLFAEGLWAEGLSAEEIEESLPSLEDKEERVLVLTSTVREAFPVIRYVTYDVVRDLRPILIDGNWQQSFKCIVKRIGPDLKHGEKISIHDIETVVLRHLNEAIVRVSMANRVLVVTIYDPKATNAVLEQIRNELEERLPEIGMMIRAGLLEPIQVIRGHFNDSMYSRAVKNKKIHYE